MPKVGIVLQGLKEFAVGGVEGVDGRGVGISKGADVVLAGGTEAGAVPAGALAEFLFLLALKVDGV